MRAVNLLPGDASRRSGFSVVFGGRSPTSPMLVGLIGGCVVVLALAVGALVAAKGESSKRAELEQRQRELALLPSPAPEAPDAGAALADQHAPRLAAVTAALSGRVAWDRILNRFSLIVPEDVWLESLDLRSAGPAEAGAPTAESLSSGMTLVGYTYSHNSVARLLSRLALVPDLPNVELQSSTVAQLGRRSVVQFTILADVRAGGASS
jgi:Tfp pilus assembly protein PilN